MTTWPRVRIDMPDAEALAPLLAGATGPRVDRVLDQLWLMTVMVEQRRRIRITERAAFDERANRVLAALDLPD